MGLMHSFQCYGARRVDLPALTGGPLCELRSIEKNALISALVRVYQLDDKTTRSALKVILDRAECSVQKGNLCEFLFGNNHRRWRQFIAVLGHGIPHLAIPLLKLMFRCGSVGDIIAEWDDLMRGFEGDYFEDVILLMLCRNAVGVQSG